MKTVFLDLDGPILDVSPRYGQLYRDLVTGVGQAIADEEYWRLKQERIPEGEILRRSQVPPDAIPALLDRRQALIETPDYLDLDRPWSWAQSSLTALAEKAPLVLVTQRNHEDQVHRQLARYGLDHFFQRILVGRGDNTTTAKAGLISSAGFQPDPASLLAGDTEVDISSARTLGIRSVGILTGIRTRRLLRSLEPDALLEDLSELAALV